MSSQTRLRRTHTKTKTGCDTCKRRRVKCDETRPFCLKCVSTGRTCHGYHPPRAWLFDPNNKSTSGPYQQDIADAVEISGHDNLYNNDLATSSLYLDWSATYRDPLIAAFLQRYLSTRSNIGITNFTGWPSIACKLAGVPRHEFLTTALMSISLCMLSYEDDDPRLWAGAVSIYQQSLPRLRRAISRLSQCHSDSLRKAVIAACFVCGHAEYMMSSCINADRHWEGVETIIHHGGIEALEDDGVRRLYYDHRSIWMNICTARTRRPVYMEPGWTSVTDKFSDVQSKTIFQRLWPVIGRIPMLLIEYEQIGTTDSPKELKSMYQRASQILEDLSKWRDDESLPARDMVPSDECPPKVRQKWQNEIENKGLEIATSLNYFSAYSLRLLAFKADIAERLRSDTNEAITGINEIQKSIRYHVTAICETLPYSLDSSHGLEGVQHMPFVLHACWKGCEAIDEVTPERIAFFSNMGARMRARCYQPLSEPWLDLLSDDTSTRTATPRLMTPDESP